jgi:hypothetical protein
MTGENGSSGKVIPSASAALILGGGGLGTPRAVAAEGLPEWRQKQLAADRQADDAALFRHVRGMVQSGRLGAVVVSGAPTPE